MLTLYFGNVPSILTLLFVLGMLFFIVQAYRKRQQIKKWGWLIALFVVVGTAISGLSATRDAYATPDALFAMSSIQSTICSIAGGAIFLTAIVSIFLKNQRFKKVCFGLMSAFFAAQVLVIEVSRITMGL